VAAASVLWYIFPATWWEALIWITEVLIVFYFVFRSRRSLVSATRWINLISATIAIALIFYIVQGHPARAGGETVDLQADDPPDIYLIILDSYGRGDVLQEAFDYDNSGFLASLRRRGFSVDDCATSNYPQTDYSLASLLMMDYIEATDREDVIEMIRHSTVRTSLEEAGYETVAFETGFRWTEILDADRYMTPAATGSNLNEFEAVFLDRTPLRLLNAWMGVHTLYGDLFRERTRYILEELPQVARIDGAQFIFAHIIPPHPPFVFSADGSDADFYAYLTAGGENHEAYTTEAYRDGYTEQVSYLNGALLPVLDQLLASEPQPIIILMGDHGPWKVDGEQMYQTLAAYYGVEPRPCSSHVNIFREGFNQRFGASLELLPDEQRTTPP
jgi:hypothetical protein